MKSRVCIDQKNAQRLLEGKPLTVRIPEGTKALEIWLNVPVQQRNVIAEWLDVFFNGRKAS